MGAVASDDTGAMDQPPAKTTEEAREREEQAFRGMLPQFGAADFVAGQAAMNFSRHSVNRSDTLSYAHCACCKADSGTGASGSGSSAAPSSGGSSSSGGGDSSPASSAA